MKKVTLGSIITFVAALLATTFTTSAAVVYWDINGATAGSGQTGTAPFKYWGTASTNAFWSTDSTGASATAAWVSGDTAVFSAGGDATALFNVTNIAAGITVGGIIVEEGTVNIRSSTTTLTGGAIVDVATGSTLTIGSTQAGTAGMKKIGGGDVYVGSGNTYTGKTIIGGGRALTTGTALTGLGAVPTTFTADQITLTNGGTVVVNYLATTSTFTWPANVGVTIGTNGGGGTLFFGGTGSIIQGTGTKFSGGVGSVLTKDGTNEFRNSVGSTVHTFEKLVVKAGKWISGTGSAGTYSDRHFGAVPASFMQDQITLDGEYARIAFTGFGTELNTLDPNRGITITSNNGGIENEGIPARIDGKITGPGRLRRLGAFTLFLNGNNDFSGGVLFSPALSTYGFTGRTGGNAGTGAIAIGHGNALGSGTVQFDVSGVIVPQVPGLVIPNKFFWNSLSLAYGSSATSAASNGGITLTNNSATYTGTIDTGSVGTAPTVTFNGSSAVSTFTGTITNVLGFTKAGLGTMEVTGANTYGAAGATNGFTTVSGGTLLVNNTTGSGTGVGDVLVSGGTLGGTGTISGAVTNLASTIAPGASVGTLTTGSETWSNGTLRVEISDATGGQGVGWDFLNINGSLNLTSETNLTLRPISLGTVNFSSSNSGGYSWKIVTASGGITGFNPANIVVNVGGFTNATDGGVFSVSNVGNDIFLNFRNAAHIVTNPSNETTAPTASTVFSVVAAGETPIAYTWKRNGADLSNGTLANGTVVSGADTASLTLANISTADISSGDLFNVGVTNTAGGAESATATITIVDPAISVEPTPLTIGAGSNAVFTVTVQGSPTITYQWNKDSLPISNSDPHYTGVNSSTLTILNVSDADEGGYDVTASNSGPQSPATSTTVALTVINPPVITAQPNSITNTGGTTASFTVTSAGDSLTYQWRKNGSNISGKTTSALSLPNVQLGDAANYDVVIANFANSVTSSVATLSLQFTLTANSSSIFGTVTANPSKALYDANESVQLTATNTNPSFGFSSWSGGASGSVNPLTVSMVTNTTITANFTSSIPDIIVQENNTENLDGSITVFTGTEWSHGLGGLDSFSFANPVYTNSLGQTNVGEPNSSAKFYPNIVTPGNYDVYFRWKSSAVNGNRATNAPVRIYHNGANPVPVVRLNEEANNNVYTLIASGKYFVAGTNNFVSADNDVTQGVGGDICIADAVKFVYSGTVQNLSSSPVSRTNNAGTTATFTVTPSGANPLTYQWQKGGVDISGETAASLTLNNVLNADEGNYTVIVSDGVTTNTTAAAALTVIDPVINTQPVGVVIGEGTNTTLSVAAAGTSLTYQWNKDGGAISGATDSSYAITSATVANSGNYTVDVTGADGALTSSTATVAVATSVVITTQPAGTNLNAGSTATFTVAASGGSLYYQWKKAGVDIASATSSSLMITNVLKTDEAVYTVVVSNVTGSATSDPATLTVVDPAITSNPISRTNNEGDGLSFSATVKGTAPIFYQWQLNGVDIAGATTNAYNKVGITTADAGSYVLIASNSYGAVTSAPATLTVITGTKLAQWNFNSAVDDTNVATGTTVPSIGSGTAALVGGATATFATGHTVADPAGTNDNSGWNTAGYAVSTNDNKLRGVQFNVSTLGYDSIIVNWQQLNSATSSRYTRLQFSTNGVDFVDSDYVITTTNTGTHNFRMKDFSAEAGVANNPNFAVRMVTEFESTATGSGTNAYVATTTTYGTGGTIRYDMVTVLGVPPSAPAVVTPLASVTANQGANVSFNAGISGGLLSYQWAFNGVDIPGATDQTLALENVQVANNGSYSVVASNIVGTVTNGPVTLTVIADSLAPKVTVTTPKKSAGTNAAFISVTGVAKDSGTGNSGIIKSVKFVLNGGATNSTVLTDLTKGAWGFASSAVELVPGPNTIDVWAIDLAGNVSEHAPFTFYYDTTNTVTLVINGNASTHVKMGTAGTWNTGTTVLSNLKVGRSYKLDAYVDSGITTMVFTNWATLPVEVGHSTNNWVQKDSLTFVVQSNMTITANFMTNPFTAVAGTYNGLFSDTNGVTHETAGFVQVKVKDKSSYSGYLLFDGIKRPFSGKLTTGGTITKVVSRAKTPVQPDVQLTLAVDLEGETISGTVSATNGAWVSEIVADKAVFSDKTVPTVLDTTYLGNYTLQLPTGAGAPSLSPGGVSYGTVSNSAAGIIKLGGLLADGQKLSQKVNISREGNWPVYVGLYKNAAEKAFKGSIMGWVKFTTNNFDTNVDNVLTWIKKDGSDVVAQYGAGFSNSLELAGSPYVAPIVGQTPVPLNVGDYVIISDGNLSEAQTNVVTAVAPTTSGTKVTLATTNTLGVVNKASIGFKTKDGTFTGGFFPPASTVKTKTQGAVLQNTGGAAGFFMGTTESGTVRIEPAP